ncbi:MAG: hypothetical protein ABI412_07570 [Sphingomicrobium sp.]
MTDPLSTGLMAASILIAVSIAAMVMLKGWQGWLDLKRMELTGPRDDSPFPAAGNRIELADLRERVRKLEAIAAGIDI